ncbi:MAG: hypothetical protein WCT37_01625 [Patescibacteria group bacterium]|jgi:hypothetical protein
MSLIKRAKDQLIKAFWGNSVSPSGLVELQKYFRLYDPINFQYKKEGTNLIAISTNFRYGSIVTSGKNSKELDENIKDAILTSFEVPSSYAQEAKIHKIGEKCEEYAPA